MNVAQQGLSSLSVLMSCSTMDLRAQQSPRLAQQWHYLKAGHLGIQSSESTQKGLLPARYRSIVSPSVSAGRPRPLKRCTWWASPRRSGRMSGQDKIAEMQKIFQSSSQYTHLQVRSLNGMHLM